MPKWLGILMWLLISATACAHKADEPPLPVVVYPGLDLGSILAEPSTGRSTADLKTMLSRPWYGAIDVAKAGEEKPVQAVNSCVDYFTALGKGLEPAKDFEAVVYQGQGLMCQAARDVSKAQSAVKSFIDGFKLDNRAPELLPKQLALVISSTEYKRMLADSSKQYWSQEASIQKTEPRGDHQTLYQFFDGSVQLLSLVAAGDFNGDGIKDLLLSSNDSIIGGSYSGVRMWLLTKYKACGDIKIIKEYQAW
jgi:hypothetical protein